MHGRISYAECREDFSSAPANLLANRRPISVPVLADELFALRPVRPFRTARLGKKRPLVLRGCRAASISRPAQRPATLGISQTRSTYDAASHRSGPSG